MHKSIFRKLITLLTLPDSKRFFYIAGLSLVCCQLSLGQVKLVGTAKKLEENRYRLTREIPSSVGAVWSESPVDFNEAFEVNFDIFLGCGNNMADGIAFVFQQQGNKALGNVGSGMGYKGITPSLIVEFDNYLNEFENFFPSTDTHVAILKNGSNDHLSVNNLAGPVLLNPEKTGNNSRCKYHKIRITWEPNTLALEVYVDDVFTLSYSGDVINTVFKGKPEAFWGFTAASSKARIGAQGILLKYKPLVATIKATTPKCPGASDADITVKMSGGLGKYSFKWSNGTKTRNLQNVKAGTYQLTVSDNWGNKLVESVVVKDPAAVKITDLTKLEANGLYNWSGKGSGGKAPYQYKKGYVILEGEAVSKAATFHTLNPKPKQLKQVFEEEGLAVLESHIDKATAQNRIAIVGFIQATDANGCSSIEYVSFASRVYPLPQPPPPVAPILTLEIDSSISNTIVQPNAPPLLSTDTSPDENLENARIIYTERNVPAYLNNRTVKTGKRVVINNETIDVLVWDDNAEDGDTISLFFNGEWILKEFGLKTKPHKLTITIDRNADNYLILYAHNEGLRPPNTAALTIQDGKSSKRIALSSGITYCDALNFKFKDKDK